MWLYIIILYTVCVPIIICTYETVGTPARRQSFLPRTLHVTHQTVSRPRRILPVCVSVSVVCTFRLSRSLSARRRHSRFTLHNTTSLIIIIVCFVAVFGIPTSGPPRVRSNTATGRCAVQGSVVRRSCARECVVLLCVIVCARVMSVLRVENDSATSAAAAAVRPRSGHEKLMKINVYNIDGGARTDGGGDLRRYARRRV